MAQSVYNIPDSSGVDFLTNINAVLGAIQTINSGATPPTDTQAGMWWGDTSDPNTFYLKMRKHTNDGWVSLYAYDVATSTIRALSNDKYLAEITGANGAVFLPSGTTAQRPTLTSSDKALRYNTDTLELEFWDGTVWYSAGGDLDINSLTDKTTPNNTDNLALQETGGLLKKVSFENLTKLSPNDQRVKTALNANGNAPIYAIRASAYVNHQTSTIIEAKGISSIFDNGVGDLYFNLTVPAPNAGYRILATVGGSISLSGSVQPSIVTSQKSVNQFNVITTGATTYAYTDNSQVYVAVIY